MTNFLKSDEELMFETPYWDIDQEFCDEPIHEMIKKYQEMDWLPKELWNINSG